MDSTKDAFALDSPRSHDSSASGQQSTTSRQVDSESVDDGEKAAMLREDLDSVMTKLQLIDDLAESCVVDSTERLRDFKGATCKDDRESLRELYAKLKARDDHIASLNATCEKLREMDKSKFEQIRRLEAIISTNENIASEKIFLKNEVSDLKGKLDLIETSTSDTFILEKLNLAYQDLIAIYDLRADIGQLLDELHGGVLNPVLQKSIVRLVREKELALHSKIGNK